RVADSGRNGELGRRDSDRRHRRSIAIALLRRRLRLHADRRRVFRRVGVPVGRAAPVGEPQGTGRRESVGEPVVDRRVRCGDGLRSPSSVERGGRRSAFSERHGPQQRRTGMKSTIPWLIAAVTGCVMIGAFFVPSAQSWRDDAGTWFEILAAIAFVLGGANLFTQHLQKISARRAGWGYSAVTLAAFLITLIVGLLKVGGPGDDPEHPWSGHYQAEGSALWWLFEYAYNPLTATMFALLAFYVASAAFRAFRAKNTEATALLVTAFIVLLGRTYAGAWLTSTVP